MTAPDPMAVTLSAPDASFEERWTQVTLDCIGHLRAAGAAPAGGVIVMVGVRPGDELYCEISFPMSGASVEYLEAARVTIEHAIAGQRAGGTVAH